MQLFVKLWKPKQAWLDMDLKERKEYVAQAQIGMGKVAVLGLETISWFEIDRQQSPHDCGYKYCSVYKTSSKEHAKIFHQAMIDFKWYDYFEQVNATGKTESPGALLERIMRL